MYVYVIGADDGPQKIGIATSPNNRLHQIRAGCPHEIAVRYSARCQSEESARRVEQSAHRGLAGSRLAGEWFNVSAQEAIQAVRNAILEVCGYVASATISAYPAAMITPGQIRAARALIGWKQSDLAAKSGVSEISIKNIERGATDARSSTLAAIQSAFLDAGVVFLDPGDTRDGGHGVRMR